MEKTIRGHVVVFGKNIDTTVGIVVANGYTDLGLTSDQMGFQGSYDVTFGGLTVSYDPAFETVVYVPAGRCIGTVILSSLSMRPPMMTVRSVLSCCRVKCSLAVTSPSKSRMVKGVSCRSMVSSWRR